MRKSNKTKGMKRFISLLFLLLALIVAASYILNLNGNDEMTNSKKQVNPHTYSEKAIETKEEQVSKEKKAETTFTEQEQTETSLENKVKDLLSTMTLDEKIGQLMVIGFNSKQIDSHAKEMITDYNVGGIIYYDRNMETPAQVTELSNQLQKLALETDKQIPLLISIDQEGGQIVRMKEQVSPIPSQQELGKKGDANTVYETAVKNGQELKAMGIHVNFAPVLDLSDTDSRSFGLDPNKAGMLGEKVIAGFTDAGITGTLKHFPGNGRSDIDPHHETSSVEADQLDLENNDIYPFKKMIDEVDNQTFFTMVTHIKYPAYDKDNPASISPIIIGDLLREKLGYKGIVVTDDLEMGAVNKYFTYKDLGSSAVAAGADLLLVCHTLESQKEVIAGIKEAVANRKLSEERIDEAVTRILMYKLSSITETESDIEKAKKTVGN
ncbi:beta-N-acetylhexosaminidase [Metabacillus malikii]|uniref:beta-N-acetylhexosaminidase n=1 Tax=Metabacillus malikii TaxID=1504265 RepID=A0ABT9ZAM0_9BACI|nr:beta-N-acetylhexosaminidase [Metabacillus malikii]MDQ0229287.1 beta-N-acetylhexosaminidase [Metabacillus malikii]